MGGNSKTAMIAAISPADVNYDETLSTLRYADQAKKIKNKAVVNEDPNAKIIRELKEELELLRSRLHVYAPEVAEQLIAQSSYKGNGNASKSSERKNGAACQAPDLSKMVNGDQCVEIQDAQGRVRKMTKNEIVEQFQTSEKLLANLNETWEEKLKKTEQIQIEREKALEELGIAVHKNNVGVYAPKKMPHLVNLNEDPLMSECLVYQLKPGVTRVGKESNNSNGSDGDSSSVQPDIRLSGSNIQEDHCRFENSEGVVTLVPSEGSLTIVNGMRISEPRRLKSGYRIILGDYHIFRFNHPEEVRRERDRQRSMVLQLGSSGSLLNGGGLPTPAMLTEDGQEPAWPGSPITDTNTIYSEPVDWNFAKLEAMRNYYASEATIGGLKDDELDKVYDEISKIRNSRRSRPVSRATFAGDDDDGSSKDSFRNSMATTTVIDGDGLESVCTENTFVNSAELEERLKSEREKLQKNLEEQKQFYETRISRMSLQLLSSPTGIQDLLSPTEVDRATDVIKTWKGLRNVSMAEVILTNAVVLKEANIISKKLNKEATYQFTIVEKGQFANPVSYWEHNSSSSLQDINQDDDTALMECPKPCIGVRVIDRKHQTVDVWSLEKLKSRLEKMRNLNNFMDRPGYRKHLNWEDPFYENPGRQYMLIGSASTSMRNLVLQQPYESSIPIVCRRTGDVKGQLHMLISPVARSSQTKPTDENLTAGQQLTFEVRLLELTGLDEEEFTNVHVQFRLSSLGGMPSTSLAEKIFATDTAKGFGKSAISLDYSQTLSVIVTDSMLQVLKHEMVAFEIYGKPRPAALKRMENWDARREHMLKPISSSSDPRNVNAAVPGVGYSRFTDHMMLGADGALERRPEEELLATERHDVVARVQVCELQPNGNYVPVQVTARSEVDRGVFTLRQGLQRRIQITLHHSSGRQFVWTNMTNAKIGRPRLLDAKGRIIDAPNNGDISIKLGHQSVVYNNDGTSELSAYGSWDSSQHECPFLNCLTATNSRVLLDLKWQVEAEKCEKPMEFSMDIAVQIQGRDKSAFRKLWANSNKRVLSNCSSVFLVHLKPPMTRCVNQLWRLNTASKYVRGEELLAGTWHPRGVSLVNDFVQIQDKIKKLESVSFTAQVLTLRAARSQTSHGSMRKPTTTSDEKELLKRVLDLWQRKHTTVKELVLSQEPPIMSTTQEALLQQQQQPTAQPPSRLLAQVELVQKTIDVTKRGQLMYQENPLDDKWVKRWLVLRRPYIYVYSNKGETDEIGIINISSVRVDYNQALERMIQRSNVFALYTNNNAYSLQAGSRAEMVDWITKIDPLFPLDKLDETSSSA